MRNVCKIVSSALRVTVGDGGDGYFGIPPAIVTVMENYAKLAVLPFGRTPRKRQMQAWALLALFGS